MSLQTESLQTEPLQTKDDDIKDQVQVRDEQEDTGDDPRLSREDHQEVVESYLHDTNILEDSAEPDDARRAEGSPIDSIGDQLTQGKGKELFKEESQKAKSVKLESPSQRYEDFNEMIPQMIEVTQRTPALQRLSQIDLTSALDIAYRLARASKASRQQTVGPDRFNRGRQGKEKEAREEQTVDDAMAESETSIEYSMPFVESPSSPKEEKESVGAIGRSIARKLGLSEKDLVDGASEMRREGFKSSRQ